VNVDDLYEQIRRVVPVGSGTDVTSVPRPVAPGIRVLALRTPTLPPAAHTNAYLVGPMDGTGPQILVDPGSHYPDQQAVLDAALTEDAAAGRPLTGIALTHHHADHTSGVAAVAEKWRVPVLAHAATARRLAGRVDVTGLLDDGDQLAGMVALHTPGHAEGHLCFAHSSAGATIAGDMVASVGTILIDPSEGDMALYLASLERLRARPQNTLLPAHGAPIVDGHAKLDEYLAHRRMRETRIVDALASRRDATQGQSIEELVAVVYADTPRALWLLAARSLQAHLNKLVAERRVVIVEGERFALDASSPAPDGSSPPHTL
jgi:ribonuclease/clavin/mitogillin